MMSLNEFKKLLGPVARNKSDEELKKVLDLQTQLADIMIDMWLRRNAK